MSRRKFLVAVTNVFFAGCISQDPTATSGPGNSSAGDQVGSNQLAITEIHPEEEVREFIDYEYIRIENVGNSYYEMNGVRVIYNGEHSYEFSSLSLQPGAVVYLVSQSQDKGRFDTEPPGYVRSANFGNSSQTSVMEGNGSVKLLSAEGEVIDKKSY